MHVAMRFAEGAFRLEKICRQSAFDHELGMGGNFDVNGFTFHQLNRLAGQSAGNAVFVLTVGNLLYTRIGDYRRTPNHDGSL